VQLYVPLTPEAEAAVPASAARNSLVLEPVSRHAMRTGNPPTGVMVGYGAPSRTSFAGALDALVRVLAEVSP
jgi:GntR family transcriptional regulator/MocR family aminotransferase